MGKYSSKFYYFPSAEAFINKEGHDPDVTQNENLIG